MALKKFLNFAELNFNFITESAQKILVSLPNQFKINCNFIKFIQFSLLLFLVAPNQMETYFH